MPEPIAICIENCHPVHESLRYLRCTAISGADTGLVVSTSGEVLWKSDEPGYCRIWVSSDERLICFRPPGFPAGAKIHRAGREVELEEGKPVVVIDGDFLLLPDLCYRIHVHGQTKSVHEPGFLDFEEPSSSTLARYAAAGIIALGSLSAIACARPPSENKKSPPVEVRDEPPAVEPDREWNNDAGKKEEEKKTEPEIEVRVQPPVVFPRPDEAEKPEPPKKPDPPKKDDKEDSAQEAGSENKPPPKPPIEVRVRPPAPVPPMRHTPPTKMPE